MEFIDHAADVINRIQSTFSTVLLILVLTMIVCMGVWSSFHSIRFLLLWPSVPATVVRYQIKRSEHEKNGQRFYHPVVQFKTAEGREIVALSCWGSWRRPWPRGSTVTVHYHPDNPRWAVIRCFATVWSMPLTAAVLLVVFSVVFL